MSTRTKERGIITPEDCLRDHTFQDWMSEVNILQRSPRGTDLKLQPGPRSRINSVNSVSVGIFDTLAKAPGYIIPLQDLLDPSYQHKEGGLKLQGYVDVLRKNIENPTDIFHQRGLGLGLGVRDFALWPDDLPFIYRLWESLWDPVKVTQLSVRAYGNDSEVARRNTIRHLLRLDYQFLRSSEVKLEHSGVTSRAKPLDDTTAFQIAPRWPKDLLPTPDSYLPRHLDFQFQDWMARKDVGLLVRQSGAEESPTNIGPVSDNLLSVLFENSGYIIPFSFFAEFVYEDERSVPNIRARLRTIRRLVDDREVVKSFKMLGIAVGVEELKLEGREVELLYQLWRRENSPVSLDEISLALYQSNDEHARVNIKNIIYRVRHALRDSAFDVVDNNRRSERRTYTLLEKNQPT